MSTVITRFSVSFADKTAVGRRWKEFGIEVMHAEAQADVAAFPF